MYKLHTSYFSVEGYSCRLRLIFFNPAKKVGIVKCSEIDLWHSQVCREEIFPLQWQIGRTVSTLLEVLPLSSPVALHNTCLLLFCHSAGSLIRVIPWQFQVAVAIAFLADKMAFAFFRTLRFGSVVVNPCFVYCR